jgi:hypothetical protein
MNGGDVDSREIPAARPQASRPGAERIVEVVCAETGISGGALLRKGFPGQWAASFR